MKLTLKDIQAPIAEEMIEFERSFRKSMKSKVMLLDKITNYIIKRKGKQMRPMFVFLMSKACGGTQDATYRGASLIELLHTATLVHDDVVDDANYRRGFFSINALWKNKVAVLVGDYLLSRGLLLAVENQDFELLKIVSTAVKEMSEGELLQMEKARKLDITEEVYFEIIQNKTASLIGSCCSVGAASSGASVEEIQRAHQFGIHVGLAFQIKDDLFDYSDYEIGKPKGIDIREKKMTLPLIYALNQADKSTKRKIINKIKNKTDSQKEVNYIIDFVKASGGIEYTQKTMEKYRLKALEDLAHFPESAAKESLKGLVEYTINRKK